MSAANEQGGAKVRFPPPAVFLLLLLAGIGLGRWQPLPAVSPALRVIGLGVLGGGLGLIAGALQLFKQSGQDPEPWKPSPALVRRGPYRFTRNPMYVGMTLLQIGIGLALGALWAVLLAPVSLFAVHHIAVVPEEAYLTERFGDDYRQLKATVRRYL